MKGGLYTVADLATWMGCERAEVERLVRQDHLPVVTIPGPTRPKIKFALSQLVIWLNDHSTMKWTADTLSAEIARALTAAEAQREARKAGRPGSAVTQPLSLAAA